MVLSRFIEVAHAAMLWACSKNATMLRIPYVTGADNPIQSVVEVAYMMLMSRFSAAAAAVQGAAHIREVFGRMGFDDR